MKDKFSWLFAEVDLYALALIRILVGISTLVYFLSFAPYLDFYFSDSGFLSVKVLRELGPLPGISLLFLSGSSKWVTLCYLALLATALLFTFGIATRITGPLLWLLTLSFVNRNVYVSSGVPLLIVQYLLILFFCDTGRVLAWRNGGDLEAGPATAPYGWAFFLLRLQLCIVYFKSGAFKLLGKDWLDGSSLIYVLANPDWARFDYSWFLNQRWFGELVSLTTRAVLYWELLFPLLVLWRPTRYLALGFGLAIHALHICTIEVGPFVPLLFAGYLAFLPFDSVRKGLLYLKKRLRRG